jgi:hypothetical protein
VVIDNDRRAEADENRAGNDSTHQQMMDLPPGLVEQGLGM